MVNQQDTYTRGAIGLEDNCVLEGYQV